MLPRYPVLWSDEAAEVDREAQDRPEHARVKVTERTKVHPTELRAVVSRGDRDRRQDKQSVARRPRPSALCECSSRDRQPAGTRSPRRLGKRPDRRGVLRLRDRQARSARLCGGKPLSEPDTEDDDGGHQRDWNPHPRRSSDRDRRHSRRNIRTDFPVHHENRFGRVEEHSKHAVEGHHPVHHELQRPPARAEKREIIREPHNSHPPPRVRGRKRRRRLGLRHRRRLRQRVRQARAEGLKGLHHVVDRH